MSEVHLRWIAWQSQGLRGPGRWSVDHLSRDGQSTLCGKPKPRQVFRDDSISGKQCPACLKRKAGLLAAGESVVIT